MAPSLAHPLTTLVNERVPDISWRPLPSPTRSLIRPLLHQLFDCITTLHTRTFQKLNEQPQPPALLAHKAASSRPPSPPGLHRVDGRCVATTLADKPCPVRPLAGRAYCRM